MTKEKDKKSDLEYCERDYKNNHNWKSIGIREFGNYSTFQIFKCSQCDKCKSERLEFVEGGSL